MKLSIITINFNNAIGLRRTLDSVVSQNNSDFEQIVIDGASSDGSTDVMNDYSCLLKHKSFISEPDSGIYNAMNKGIRLASGEYLLFLNSGDVFASEDVVDKFISSNPTAEIVAGNERFESGGRYVPPCEKDLTYDYLIEQPLMHQSVFIERNAFFKYGFYSEQYKIVSDWEWWIKSLVIGNATYQRLDFDVAIFDLCGISNQDGKIRDVHSREAEEVRKTLLPRVDRMTEELSLLRQTAKEYEYLQNGKFSPIIKTILYLKKMNKR